MENYRRYKSIFQLNTTYGVPPLSHNVVVKQNTVASWIPEMTILLVKNNDVSHTILANPNKHVGALDLGIELGGFFDTPLVVDTLYN